MSGVVVTRANETARAHDANAARDLYGPDDLEVSVHNLLVCARGGRDFRAWDVDRGDPHTPWLRRPG